MSEDFTVYRSPLQDFQREVAAAGLEDRVRYLRRGETAPLPPPPDARRPAGRSA